MRVPHTGHDGAGPLGSPPGVTARNEGILPAVRRDVACRDPDVYVAFRRGPSASRGVSVADQLTVEELLALGLADGDDLVALFHHRVRSEGTRGTVPDDGEE
jgi:hypothetical protein